MYFNTSTRATQQQQLRLCRPNVAFLFRPMFSPLSRLCLPSVSHFTLVHEQFPSFLSLSYARRVPPKTGTEKRNAIHPHTHARVNRTEEEEKSPTSPPRLKKPRVKTC